MPAPAAALELCALVLVPAAAHLVATLRSSVAATADRAVAAAYR
jgi:hypothetical protein